jgi:hypothetical protein
MTPTQPQRRKSYRGSAWLVPAWALALGLSATAGWAQKPENAGRMMRQIGVMEGIVDKLLLDSPNFLVSVGHNTRGLYIPEYGAVFTFQASLTSGKQAINAYLKQLGTRFEIQTDENGDEVVITKSGKEKGDSSDEEATAESKARLRDAEKKLKDAEEKVQDTEKKLKEKTKKLREKDRGSSAGWRDLESVLEGSEDEEVSAGLYKAGKEELVQVLLDYGETLSQLRNGQWIVLAAYLDKSDFFKANDISRLIMRMKVDDLRAYSAGKLDEKEMRSRIQTDEY